MQSMIVSLAFHILAAVIWVGGMFFAHMCLRPSAGPLEPVIRLPLWHRVLSRFFPWVWLSILALLASGFAMVFLGFGGFAAVGIHVHIMMALGIVMMVIFAYLYFAPCRPPTGRWPSRTFGRSASWSRSTTAKRAYEHRTDPSVDFILR